LGSGDIAPRILTSALGGSKWLASRSGRFTAGERALDNHWIGGESVWHMCVKSLILNQAPRHEDILMTPTRNIMKTFEKNAVKIRDFGMTVMNLRVPQRETSYRAGSLYTLQHGVTWCRSWVWQGRPLSLQREVRDSIRKTL